MWEEMAVSSFKLDDRLWSPAASASASEQSLTSRKVCAHPRAEVSKQATVGSTTWNFVSLSYSTTNARESTPPSSKALKTCCLTEINVLHEWPDQRKRRETSGGFAFCQRNGRSKTCNAKWSRCPPRDPPLSHNSSTTREDTNEGAPRFRKSVDVCFTAACEEADRLLARAGLQSSLVSQKGRTFTQSVASVLELAARRSAKTQSVRRRAEGCWETLSVSLPSARRHSTQLGAKVECGKTMHVWAM